MDNACKPAVVAWLDKVPGRDGALPGPVRQHMRRVARQQHKLAAFHKERFFAFHLDIHFPGNHIMQGAQNFRLFHVGLQVIGRD